MWKFSRGIPEGIDWISNILRKNYQYMLLSGIQLSAGHKPWNQAPGKTCDCWNLDDVSPILPSTVYDCFPIFIHVGQDPKSMAKNSRKSHILSVDQRTPPYPTRFFGEKKQILQPSAPPSAAPSFSRLSKPWRRAASLSSCSGSLWKSVAMTLHCRESRAREAKPQPQPAGGHPVTLGYRVLKKVKIKHQIWGYSNYIKTNLNYIKYKSHTHTHIYIYI